MSSSKPTNDTSLRQVKQSVETALKELEVLAAEWVARQGSRITGTCLLKRPLGRENTAMSVGAISDVDANLACVAAAQT